MKDKIISKRDLAGLVDKLLGEYEIFAPVKKGSLVLFDRVHSGTDAFFEYANTLKSPKEIFLPQSEVLFTYSHEQVDGAANIEAPPGEDRPRLVIGIRPCDAKAICLFDRVFSGEKYEDSYYRNRRANTAVVAIGCAKPRSTCFCTSVGGGPFSAEGSDLLLVDIGDDYVVQIGSDKGERLVEALGLADPAEDSLSMLEGVIRDAEASMAPGLALDGLKEKLDNMFDDPLWSLLTEKCLSCGICTYLCPTCHCFDIVDEAIDSGGERIRIWDSCQFPLFTLQASGFNPRPTTRERHRQRVMHKFSYLLDNYGQFGCVGCGRCVTQCPVNLDIRSIITSILMGKVVR
jgi:ferredoxin